MGKKKSAARVSVTQQKKKVDGKIGSFLDHTLMYKPQIGKYVYITNPNDQQFNHYTKKKHGCLTDTKLRISTLKRSAASFYKNPWLPTDP